MTSDLTGIQSRALLMRKLPMLHCEFGKRIIETIHHASYGRNDPDMVLIPCQILLMWITHKNQLEI